MDEEKRMLDNYEVRQSVKFGGREYILAEDKIGKVDMPYMTCVGRWDNPFGVMEHENGMVSDDYLEIFNIFIDRISEQAKHLSAERSENGISNKPLTAADCVKGGLDKSIEGQIIIIKPSSLSPEYRIASHQIKLATSGFGCQPDSRGSAVFCTDIFSGKSSRFEKYDVAGVVDIAKLPDWAKQKMAELGKGKEKTSIMKDLEEKKKALSQKKSDTAKKKNEQEL